VGTKIKDGEMHSPKALHCWIEQLKEDSWANKLQDKAVEMEVLNLTSDLQVSFYVRTVERETESF